MNKELKAGDVVYLKSGSVAFTAQEVGVDYVYITYYHNGVIIREKLTADLLTTEGPN